MICYDALCYAMLCGSRHNQPEFVSSPQGWLDEHPVQKRVLLRGRSLGQGRATYDFDVIPLILQVIGISMSSHQWVFVRPHLVSKISGADLPASAGGGGEGQAVVAVPSSPQISKMTIIPFRVRRQLGDLKKKFDAETKRRQRLESKLKKANARINTLEQERRQQLVPAHSNN
eukprot:7762176-Pyramimonas_sp.AAC.1